MEPSNKRFVLIRHAQSLQNQAWEASSNWNDVQFQKQYLDCDLSKLGYEQTTEAREIANKINIKIVYVSPLKRTLITAREVFKDHPSKPKFVVVPLLREKITATCDIPGDIHVLLKDFPEFDFSLLTEKAHNKLLWVLDSF